MPDFLYALAWGLALLLALAGLGRAAQRLLRFPAPSRLRLWLDAPAWGIAAASLLGSLLNLASLATAAALITLTLTSDLLAIALLLLDLRSPRRLPRKRPRDLPFTLLTLLLLVLLALRFTSSVTVDSFHIDPRWHGIRFNTLDDMHSYLVSPIRMLQTGSLGHDPFNSRSMMSALGAQHTLTAMTIAPLAEDHAHLLEGGVALAALCAAAAALAYRLGASRRLAATAALIPLLIDFTYTNLSANVTVAATLLALASALLTRRDLLRPLRIAFLLAAACSLKGTAIPPAVLLVATAFLGEALLRKSLRPRRIALRTASVTFLRMLPGMRWQYASSGTLLYPLLGAGYHITRWHLSPFPPQPLPEQTARRLWIGISLPLLLLILSALALLLPATRRRLPARLWPLPIAFFLAWAVSWLLITNATQTPDVFRYLTAPRAAGLVLAFALLARIAPALPPRIAASAAPIAFLLIALFTADEWVPRYFTYTPRDLAASFASEHLVRGPHNEILNRIRQLQSHVPPGQPLLVYLAEPALLDFRRNPIFVADWPGEVSPPPGMPVFSGGRAVRDYLLAHHIRYVAYAYRRQANFSRQYYADYATPAAGSVLRRQAAESFAFQDDLTEIAANCATLYKNPEEILLDLATPITQPSP